jgi:hypothetical protein
VIGDLCIAASPVLPLRFRPRRQVPLYRDIMAQIAKISDRSKAYQPRSSAASMPPLAFKGKI